jgi:DNA-binding NarL/FixJ family response regulator
MDKIKVLLAEDHTIVRKGLRSLLEKEGSLEVIGEAVDGRDAVKMVEKLTPDVVVMDISMPGLNGLEATRQIKKRFSGIKIIILTVHTNEEYVFQTLQAGASGYLIKSAAPTDLISAIQAAVRGESFLSPSISKTVIDEYIRQAQKMSEGEKGAFELLTQREREILQLIAEGHTIKEIAEILFISIKTVETHKSHLKEKLNIPHTAGLIQYALKKGVPLRES